MLERLLTNRMLSMSLLAIVVATVVVVFQLPGLMSSLLTPSISGDKTREELDQSLQNHQIKTIAFRDRFVGRSIFFMPDPPRPPIVQAPIEPIDTTPKEQPKPPPPTIPDKYGGPEILALLGDQVHVTGPKILKLGVEDPSLGLTVLEFVPPWSVKVQWLKKPGNYAPGTYVVEMFQRGDDSVLSKDGNGSSSVPDGLSQADDKSAAVDSSRVGASPVVED